MTDRVHEISAAHAGGDSDPTFFYPPTDAVDDEQDVAAEQARAPRRGLARRAVASRLVSTILAVLVLITGSVATWLYFKQYRPDQQTDASAARAVLSAATDGTVALLSYSSDTLDQDFAKARSYLAGDFLSYYNDFTLQVVAPSARQKSLKTTAHVTDAAVSELQPYSAVVLLFVDQTTKTKDSPQPSIALSSARVHMTRTNGKWLITKFAPV